MSLNTRDKDGYPWEGIDVVPARPKPSKMVQLMRLLQEANLREEKERDRADYWKRMYYRVSHEYIALQFEDLCSDCKRVKDGTDPGDTYTLYQACHRGKETLATLTRKLEEKEKEKNYWRYCYETALRQLGDFSDGQLNHDGGGHDDPHPRV